jgi:hypothetical protein
VTGPSNPDIYDDGGVWKTAHEMKH